MIVFRKLRLLWVLVIAMPGLRAAFHVDELADSVAISAENFRLEIQKQGFRYGFKRADGAQIVEAHATSGLEFGGGVAVASRIVSRTADRVIFEVTNDRGGRAEVILEPQDHAVRFLISSLTGTPGKIVARTAGLSPAYGLGDSGGMGRHQTELTGFVDESLHAVSGSISRIETATRLMSSFVIFPRHELAEVCFEPRPKVVRLTKQENAQGTTSATVLPPLYYFFGPPQTIYREFLAARNREGFKVYQPKSDWFGLGWEAWGALAWDTNQQTVMANVEKYLSIGYPLQWMVVGSGFWPRQEPRFLATTSFGMWDEKLYPEPRSFIRHFQERGLKFIIGLRIAFIVDGPFASEGLRRGAFLKEKGEAKVFKLRFPRRECYLLDAQNPDAVSWYVGLCQKWLDDGVDGFKEDLFGYETYVLRDDKLDPVNAALMDRGVLVMGRNGFIGSPMDVHRIEDFNNDQNQDRGPLNILSLAYSGFTAPYPDLVGGTFLVGGTDVSKRPSPEDPEVQRYYMRAAQFASVTPVMAMGYGPWNFHNPELDSVVLAAAKLHAQLQPYIYSAAVDSARDGFPHCMTPLPVAFPNDPNVYALENSTRRGYQWMMGASLLATPLFGDDYRTADARDVYLPEGTWIDYDTGEAHVGPKVLTRFRLPVGKTPLFVGGKGMLVLRDLDSKQLQAVVYHSVGKPGDRYEFTHPDGRSRSIISRTAVEVDSTTALVLDVTDNRTVAHSVVGPARAICFRVVPGHDYRVTTPSTGPVSATAAPGAGMHTKR